MVLDGIVDPVAYTKSAETRVASQARGVRRGLRHVPGPVRERGSWSLCPGRARRDRRAAGGASVRHRQAVVDPGAALGPARRARLRRPDSRPSTRSGPERTGPASPQTSTLRRTATHRRWRTWPALSGPRPVSRARPPRRRSRASTVPPASPPSPGPVSSRSSPTRARCTDRCWAGGCGRRARRTGRGESTDRYAGPWGATTTTPILLMNNRHDPATGYQNAVVAEQRLGNAVLLTAGRLRPPDDERSQPVRRPGEDPLPRDPRPAGPRHRLQGRRAAIPLIERGLRVPTYDL